MGKPDPGHSSKSSPAESKIFVVLMGTFGVALVGSLDFLTGHTINLSFFYTVPIVYASWKGGWRLGIPIATASGIVAMLADLWMDKVTAHQIFSYWNAANRISFFALVVFMVDKIQSLYSRQVRLGDELSASLSEIRRLSGMLPICSWCKKIRGDSGYWQQVEEYVTAHSEAEFTHGICPECDSKVRHAIQTTDP